MTRIGLLIVVQLYLRIDAELLATQADSLRNCKATLLRLQYHNHLG